MVPTIVAPIVMKMNGENIDSIQPSDNTLRDNLNHDQVNPDRVAVNDQFGEQLMNLRNEYERRFREMNEQLNNIVIPERLFVSLFKFFFILN